MKYVLLFTLSIFLVGCIDQDNAKVVVNQYWEAVYSDDIDKIKSLVVDPKNVKRRNFKQQKDTFKYVGIEEQENSLVSARFSRDCYEDLIISTITKKVDGKVKVDEIATNISMFRATVELKTTKKYCYNFSDEPMSGKIGGKNWKPEFVKIVDRFVIASGKKESFYSLVANRSCAESQCSHISLDNIDLNTNGGNLSFKKLVLFYTFPSINVFAVTGSYRVTKIDNETKKLEFSIKADEDNYINGYFIINANSILDTRFPQN